MSFSDFCDKRLQDHLQAFAARRPWWKALFIQPLLAGRLVKSCCRLWCPFFWDPGIVSMIFCRAHVIPIPEGILWNGAFTVFFLTKTTQSSLLIIWLCTDGNVNGFIVTFIDFIADSGSTYQPWSSALAVFLMHTEPQPEWMLLADALISAPWLKIAV